MARGVLSAAVLVLGLLVAVPSHAQSNGQKPTEPSQPAATAQPVATTQQASICFTAAELEQLQQLQGRLKASQSPCDTCVDIAAWIIGKVGCGAGEGVLDLACTAAEAVFFELDEIIAPICTGLEIGLGALCEEYGADWIAAHTRDAARIICQNVKICSAAAPGP